MHNPKTNTVLLKLTICLITLMAFEACAIFGIEKIEIRKSEFTHDENDILCQAKLNSIKTKSDENIVFPVYISMIDVITMDRPERRKESYHTVKYQPTILFLTKERFILNMGCTIYGRFSKSNNDSYDILYTENSNDCQKKELNEIQFLVMDALKTSNKLVVEKENIYFKRGEKVLMVYTIDRKK